MRVLSGSQIPETVSELGGQSRTPGSCGSGSVRPFQTSLRNLEEIGNLEGWGVALGQGASTLPVLPITCRAASGPRNAVLKWESRNLFIRFQVSGRRGSLVSH